MTTSESPRRSIRLSIVLRADVVTSANGPLALAENVSPLITTTRVLRATLPKKGVASAFVASCARLAISAYSAIFATKSPRCNVRSITS